MAIDAAIHPATALHSGADCELERLYRLHAKQVLGYCRRQLGGRSEAEDATQTVFLYALRGLRRGIVPAAHSAWLFTIAHNVCRTYWRGATRRQRVEDQRDPQVLQEIAAGREPEHEELFGLDDALARIPEAQRRALLLREWHGLSYREIAQTLGTTQPAVEMLLFRARRSLAAELRGDGRLLRLPKSVAGIGELLSGFKVALGGSSAAKLAAAAAVVAALSTSGADPAHRALPKRLNAQAPATAAAAAAPSESPSSESRSARTASSGATRRHGHAVAGSGRDEGAPPRPIRSVPASAGEAKRADPSPPAQSGAPEPPALARGEPANAP